MKLSKFFLKNFIQTTFFKKFKYIMSLNIKSKISTSPFRHLILMFCVLLFCSKVDYNCNVNFYKNFDLFNYNYYGFFPRVHIKNIFIF